MSDLRQAASFALRTLQGWSGHGHWRWTESALAQAKQNTAEAIPLLEAALAEPEPEEPTDEELRQLYCELFSLQCSPASLGTAPVRFARAVLARWGNRQEILDSSSQPH